jgi:peptide/nickel transport system substrate-binding protein
MTYRTKFLIIAGLFVLLGIITAPILAQDKGGQGGIVIEPNSNNNGDVATFNPLLGNDVYSFEVNQFLYPNLIGIDPEKGVFTPGARGSLAKDWKISDDGLTYTYTLRNDWKWSDGTPITAQDFIYAYNAIASGKTSSPRAYAAAPIVKIEAPDDYTLVVTYKTAACNNLDNTTAITPIPSHIFQQQIGTDYSKMDSMDFNKNPVTSAGPFSFAELQAGQQVSLEANQDYPDTLEGFVSPAGFIYKNVADVNVALEQFLAGDVNFIRGDFSSIPPQNFADLRQRTQSGEIKSYESLNNGYEWLAFNLSDPAKPVNGLDDKGNVIDQGHHPIFGDVRARKAFAMAIDVDAIIQGALFGEGVRTTSPSISTSWAYNPDLKPIPFDAAAAGKLLDEAGWVDDDNNPDTPRVAKGAMYAADGTTLKFTLITGAGDKTVEAVGAIIQDQLKKVGADVDYQVIAFNTAVEKLVGQTFDAALLGWFLNYPDDPDFSFAFAPENDKVPGGFNFVSYNNPEVTDLLKQGSNLPGCDPAGRAKLYQQAQEKLVDDQPYVFLYTAKHMIVASGKMDGFGPYPNQPLWNVDSWALTN